MDVRKTEEQAHELRFIDKLGSFGDTGFSRLELLQRYAKAVQKRKKSDNLHLGRIHVHIQQCIEKEQQRR